MTKISKELGQKYSEQYAGEEDDWRLIGARGKADNIINLSPGLSPDSKVLDVGSGDGSVLYWLDKFQFCENVLSLEISQSGIEKIRNLNLNSITGIAQFDGYKIPFEDNSFDLALCSHVIEHVEYPRMLIREIVRVSKQQIFEVPIDFSFRVDRKVRHFLSYGHINIYTPQTFRFLLQSEGLDILQFQNTNYEREVFYRIIQNKSFPAKFVGHLKRVVWRILPFLMTIKPNATTVRTQKSENPIPLMTI